MHTKDETLNVQKSVIFQFDLYLLIRWSHGMDTDWTCPTLCLTVLVSRWRWALAVDVAATTTTTWEVFLVMSTYRKLVMRWRKIWKTKLIIKSTRFWSYATFSSCSRTIDHFNLVPSCRATRMSFCPDTGGDASVLTVHRVHRAECTQLRWPISM